MLVADGPPLSAPHHLAFAVEHDGFDPTLEALSQAGAPFQEPWSTPFGDRLVFFFTDPAGNLAQIVGRRDPLAPEPRPDAPSREASGATAARCHRSRQSQTLTSWASGFVAHGVDQGIRPPLRLL
jgi:hypothetical protein